MGTYPGHVPFTISHVAAVLPASRVPLLRDPVVTSALVVGAMAPDVPYFLPRLTWWQWSHSWPGLITVCIPITLLLVAVY